MRKLALALLGGAIGLALAFALLLLLNGGGGHVRAAENDPIAYIGIDMDPTGNELPSAAGPGALGPRNRCRSVNSAGNPIITVDVYADSIPLDEEATSYGYQFYWAPNGFTRIAKPAPDVYKEGMLTFGYYDAPEEGWVGQCGNGLDDDGDTAVDDGCPAPGPLNTQNLLPGNYNTVTLSNDARPDAIPPWNTGAALLTSGEQSWNGDQVIHRIPIQITAAGPQVVNLWLKGNPLQVNIVAPDEVGVYTNPVGAKIDGVYLNDGCPAVAAPETDVQCLNSSDDDGDGARNDGCPQVGPVAEVGDQCNNWQNDDPGQDSEVQLAIDTPCPDSDNDGWSDADEVYLGTDPLDACPDNTSDPAWPLDQDNDTWIKIIDVQKYTGKLFTPVTCPGSAKCRLDLNVDGFILLVGDVTIYAGRLFERCP